MFTPSRVESNIQFSQLLPNNVTGDVSIIAVMDKSRAYTLIIVSADHLQSNNNELVKFINFSFSKC